MMKFSDVADVTHDEGRPPQYHGHLLDLGQVGGDTWQG